MRKKSGLLALISAAAVTAGAGFVANTAAAAGTDLVINEVESNGGTPGDWVELYNPTSADISLAGYTVLDNDVTHTPAALPVDATVAAGAYYVVEETVLGFGLGGADSATLAKAGTVVDTYSWTTHAAITYGRCPNGVGEFVALTVSTKAAANTCPELSASPTASAVVSPTASATDSATAAPSVSTPPVTAWSGASTVATADAAALFTGDLSGLDYTADGKTVWAVVNGTGALYALDPDTGAPIAGWEAGKLLHYADGTGIPDSEGVTTLPTGELFVATERNNASKKVSRMSVLQFDPNSGSELSALREWNFNGTVIPTLDANLGFEAIEYISDADLAAMGYTYTPSEKAHFGGIFLLGLEGNGHVYAVTLNEDGTSAILQDIPTRWTGVMGLDFNNATRTLRAFCDDTCQGQSVKLAVVDGAFKAVEPFMARPADMPNINNEGVAISPVCTAGRADVLFSDDGDTDGFSLRRASIDCLSAVTVTLPAVTETATATVTAPAVTQTVATTVTVKAPAATVTVPAPKGDLYSTPGFHNVNGRMWYTACEPYSATLRCRTEIWASVMRYQNGQFVRVTGWQFNNLTYLPMMTRGQWGSNPLVMDTVARPTTDKWRVECNTPATGQNACRSYYWTSYVVQSGTGFAIQSGWAVNNIVRFKTA